MSKALAKIGTIAGAVALVAGGLATLNPGMAIGGVKLGTVAVAAGIVSAPALLSSTYLERAPRHDPSDWNDTRPDAQDY